MHMHFFKKHFLTGCIADNLMLQEKHWHTWQNRADSDLVNQHAKL